MLLPDLRELLKKKNEKELRILIAEMYKLIPKKLREEKNIDSLLIDIKAYTAMNKGKSKQANPINFRSLKNEIELFIENAYQQNYFAPNKYVHKKDRPKWRFKVKAYIKDLQTVAIDSEEGKTATYLLQCLYQMLSYACGTYIFNTDDPFRSVGIEQAELLDIVIKRLFGNGINNDSAKTAVNLVINSELDRETLHSDLFNKLISNLKTPDAKMIALAQCKLIKNEIDKAKPTKSKRSGYLSIQEYSRTRKINYLVELVLILNLELSEYDAAIKYFKDNSCEIDKEVTLYKLLLILYLYDLQEYWLREYAAAIKKGIKLRRVLKDVYQYVLENNEFPESFSETRTL